MFFFLNSFSSSLRFYMDLVYHAGAQPCCIVWNFFFHKREKYNRILIILLALRYWTIWNPCSRRKIKLWHLFLTSTSKLWSLSLCLSPTETLIQLKIMTAPSKIHEIKSLDNFRNSLKLQNKTTIHWMT